MRRSVSLHRFFLTCLVVWLFWLVLTDNLGWREILAGGLSAVIATIPVAVYALKSHANFTVRAGFLEEGAGVPAQLVSDTGILLRSIFGRVAGEQPPSGIVAVPFRRGGNTPSSCMRRALAITYMTVTPNTLVLGIAEKNIFIFHTIVPRPLPPFMRRLGAKPEHES